jgi:hypothetical protein
MEVTVVESGEAPTEPIRLPASFEVPAAEAAPQISEATMATLTKMKADDIEALVRKRIGPKADGIAEAIKALPPEALPFALKMFPPDALRPGREPAVANAPRLPVVIVARPTAPLRPNA